MEQAMTFKDPGGHTISAILTRPSGGGDAVAVLCHGFLSGKNSTTNKTLTRILVDRGVSTFRFDFFGHGESEGPFESITVTHAVTQALAALTLVAGEGFTRVGLMGSSFGGLVSILAASRWANLVERSAGGTGEHAPRPDDEDPKRGLACLALKCPVVDFPEELEIELGAEGMDEWRRTNTVPDFAGGSGRLRLSYDFYEDATRNVAYAPASTITAPTLIVQGDRDELIPLHQSERLHESLSLAAKRELRLIAGADHQFSKGEDFRAMAGFISDWLMFHLSVSGV